MVILPHKGQGIIEGLGKSLNIEIGTIDGGREHEKEIEDVRYTKIKMDIKTKTRNKAPLDMKKMD
jgi:hypothetical protein